MIDILMATYNGGKYISEQINSILNQTYKEWTLYIRDDGSKDNTVDIIDDYCKKYPGKIIRIKDDKLGLGAKLNFSELMKYSKSNYCMFADQDDVWLNTKIEDTMNKMIESENVHGKETPILVHTDLKVVDGNLNIINESFWRYQNLNKDNKSLNTLLVQNNITGCTMMMNKSLMKLGVKVPKDCIMHDWWIGLIASGLGKIYTVDKPTMLYRQHGNNEVGAHKYNSIKFIKNKAKDIEKINKSINDGILQATAFYDEYKEKLSKSNQNTVYNFSQLRKKGPITRKLSIVTNKFYKSGLIRNISYFIFI